MSKINWVIIIVVVLLVIFGLWYAGGKFEKNNINILDKEGAILETEKIPEPVGSMLVGTDWTWQRTERGDGKDFIAPQGGEFILRFSSDGRVSSSTDCNTLTGDYVKDGEILSFGSLASTRMYCKDSIETEYARDLSYTNSFTIKDDELHLILARDAGVMIFKK